MEVGALEDTSGHFHHLSLLVVAAKHHTKRTHGLHREEAMGYHTKSCSQAWKGGSAKDPHSTHELGRVTISSKRTSALGRQDQNR